MQINQPVTVALDTAVKDADGNRNASTLHEHDAKEKRVKM